MANSGMLIRRAFRPVGGVDIWEDSPAVARFSLCNNLTSWML